MNKPSLKDIKAHAPRNAFHLVGQFGWVIGVMYLTLAEVTAIEFTVPIWILLISFLLLKEKLNAKKITAITLGFIGVLVVIRPGVEIVRTESMIVLASTVAYAFAHIFTKKLTAKYESKDIVFYMCLLQAPVAFLIALPTLSIPNTTDLALLLLIGVTSIMGHFMFTKALEGDDVSSIITLDYLRLPILLTAGTLFYNEPLDAMFIVGGIIIISANWINRKK